MEINELIQKLRESLPEPMDYAEMVGAPVWAYGCMYAYDDPLYFYVEEAIEKLSEMQDKLDMAEKDVQKILWSCDNEPCDFCQYNHYKGAKLENTPCDGCDLINHFEWKGR